MLIVLFLISLLCIFFGWVITIKGRNDTTCRTIWYSLYHWDLDDHIRCIGYVCSFICAFFIAILWNLLNVHVIVIQKEIFHAQKKTMDM